MSANGLHLRKWTVALILVTLGHLNNLRLIKAAKFAKEYGASITCNAMKSGAVCPRQ